MPSDHPTDHSIRLAFIGAGIFARDAHLPSVLALGDTFEIAAVYNHRLDSAAPLLEKLPPSVAASDITDDLAGLLARDDIEAVNVLLPIDVMPGVVEQALRAGKHVISEKPIAPDVATGRRLLDIYTKHNDAEHSPQVWMVAENWRYEAALLHAAEIIQRGDIGAPLLCHWAMHTGMMPDNKYYHTGWRRSGTWPGGFLLDGGVHHVAGLRLVLGEIAAVSAMTTQHRPDLPPADTLVAILEFECGVTGTYCVTYATDAPWPPALRIVGEQGALALPRQGLEITRNGHTQHITLPAHQSVQAELAAFAAAIRTGARHRNSPQQALQDVAVIEAMLRSAESGQRLAPERFV
ncbi:MAG: Gfo/Idh/MocA family oxidoreductase [Chloroflexi bacterium]|nr:Gfo/Idh/MocA family oxidoreductase [Chloroflexota bacterium]